ncbi:MAG: hypothetical protein ACTSVK_16310 [Promethearchaeota archaeon]
MNDNISKLLKRLNSKNDIEVLQSIEEILRFCKQDPGVIDNFIKNITPLLENDHPWIKKNTKKCLKIIQEIKKKSKMKSYAEDSSNHQPIIDDIDSFLDYILLILEKKANFRSKIEEMYSNFIDKETKPSLPEQVKKLIENHATAFFSSFFSIKEMKKISVNLDIPFYEDYRLMSLEILKKLGYKLSRGDFLGL